MSAASIYTAPHHTPCEDSATHCSLLLTQALQCDSSVPFGNGPSLHRCKSYSASFGRYSFRRDS